MGGIPLIDLKHPRFPFHVPWKILLPYSRFSRIDKTDLKDFLARVFSNNFDFLEIFMGFLGILFV